MVYRNARADEVTLELDAGGAGEPEADRPRRAGALLNAAETRLLISALTLVTGAIAASTVVTVPVSIKPVVVLAHIAFTVVGLGAVLSLDWYGLLVAIGWLTVGDVLVHERRISPMIWIGVAGLVVSGSLLSPTITHTLTAIKLIAVLGTVTVGVLTLGLTRRMQATLPRVRPLHFRLLIVLGVISQVCWWTAVVIGFVNHG